MNRGSDVARSMMGVVLGVRSVMRRVLCALCLLLVVGGLTTSAPATAAPSTATTIYVAILSDLSPRLAGQQTDFTAVLAAGEAPVPGEVLTLWLRPEGSSTFAEAGHATTDASGRATVWTTLQQSVVAHWTHEDSGAYGPSTSADYGVQIAPRVTARAHDRSLRRGQRLVVTGRTFPAKAGCGVALWKGELRPLFAGPAPVRLARSTVRADGSYRLARRFHRATAVRVAVVVSSCAGNARGLSRYLAIRVR